MNKIHPNEINEIKHKLPFLQSLIEENNIDYKIKFISVFDHWLTRNEFEIEMENSNDETTLLLRRENLKSFVIKLFESTKTYSWKFKRKNRFFIYPFLSINQILNKCNFENQNWQTGNRYVIIIPEFEAIYKEGWDWSCELYFKDENKIQPLIKLVENSGLFILNTKD